jgi:hypothetical protein
MPVSVKIAKKKDNVTWPSRQGRRRIVWRLRNILSSVVGEARLKLFRYSRGKGEGDRRVGAISMMRKLLERQQRQQQRQRDAALQYRASMLR